jgi:hypothetical protein
LDIVITALDDINSAEELQAWMGDDHDQWPVMQQELLKGIVEKERPALWRSRGLKEDGTITEERKRLVYLERLAELVRASAPESAGEEGGVVTGALTVDKDTAEQERIFKESGLCF